MAKKRVVSADENKKIAFEGLCSLTSICDQYGLRYYLAFGTLIGAVRHKGFIPWDDDIDLLMPRADYEKLRSIAAEIKSADWELLSYSNEPGYLLPFMKYCNRRTSVVPSRFGTGFIYGLSIDIFPLDFCEGETEEAVKKEIFGIKYRLKDQELKSYKIGVLGSGAKNFVKRVIKKALFMLNTKRVNDLRKEYERLDKMLEEKTKHGGEYAVYMYDRYDTVWKKKDFMGSGDEFSTLTFEGKEFTAPYDYHAVLQKTYGDYMKLPPKEKQVPIHTYVAYFRD